MAARSAVTCVRAPRDLPASIVCFPGVLFSSAARAVACQADAAAWAAWAMADAAATLAGSPPASLLASKAATTDSSGGASVPLANDSAIRRAASTASRRLSLCAFPSGSCARGSTLRAHRAANATIARSGNSFSCSSVKFASFMFTSPVGAIVPRDDTIPDSTLGITRPAVAASLQQGPRAARPPPGVFQVQRPDRGGDDVGDDGPREPFVIGRDHIPGSPPGAGRRQAVWIRPHGMAPEHSIGQVRRGELPVLVRLVEPLEEPPLLLVLRHLQEEHEDDRPVPGEVPLERVDVLVAPSPELSLAGAVAAAAFSNDRPATDSGVPGGLNANRFPAGSTVTLPTKGGPCSCARVRIWS